MSLLELLTLGVGTGISKGILKLWLKDIDIAEEVGGSFIDLIEKVAKDKITERKVERQFGEIADKVGQQIYDLFEKEGVNFEEESLKVAANAAEQVLKNTPFSARILTQMDFDVSDLRAHFILNQKVSTDHFSEIQKSYFDRIISEASQYIIDISSQLPNYKEYSVAEILKRERIIIEKADMIIEEVRRLRAKQVSGVNQKSAYFETEYRRAVVRRLDHLELFGTDLSSATNRYQLSVAYVSLVVVRDVSNVIRDNSDDSAEVNELISVEGALMEANRLFVRGVAGSGKTTLLQWISVKAASQTFDGILENWNDKIPFYIRLRDCVESGLPAPENFVEPVAPAISGTMPEGWVHQKLENGRAIVLVDGLDEVPGSERERVRLWLNDLVNTYPDVNYILTSRPYAADRYWLKREKFCEVQLQEMDLYSVGILWIIGMLLCD